MTIIYTIRPITAPRINYKTFGDNYHLSCRTTHGLRVGVSPFIRVSHRFYLAYPHPHSKLLCRRSYSHPVAHTLHPALFFSKVTVCPPVCKSWSIFMEATGNLPLILRVYFLCRFASLLSTHFAGRKIVPRRSDTDRK